MEETIILPPNQPLARDGAPDYAIAGIRWAWNQFVGAGGESIAVFTQEEYRKFANKLPLSAKTVSFARNRMEGLAVHYPLAKPILELWPKEDKSAYIGVDGKTVENIIKPLLRLK